MFITIVISLFKATYEPQSDVIQPIVVTEILALKQANKLFRYIIIDAIFIILYLENYKYRS